MDALRQLTDALTGRYEIEREIGAGGMATVYLARDGKHDRKVALKVLKPELGAVLGVERFLAEIRVTANLQHPNLLPLFDSGEAAGLLFYVMPFVEGESLRARLGREKQLPVDEAVRIAVALAGALEYAHQHGVIHRDLKPENVLLQAGQPVIADFGIALAVSNAGGARVTQTGLSLGTPQYMSPEQATGDRAIDARTDIYSLAAMTYEMITGEAPHTGTSAQAIIAKLMTEEVRPLSVLRRTVPPHVDAAVRHALQKLAADRFGSAAEFALALTGARPVPLTGVTAAQGGAANAPASRRPRGREWLAWGLAAAAVVVAFWPRAPRDSDQPLGRFAMPLPDGYSISNLSVGRRVAISRDGRRVALVLNSPSARQVLLMRTAEDPEFRLLPGAEGVVSPVFSPDGRFLLYAVGTTKLLKIPVEGGTPVTIVSSGTPDELILLGDWGDDGRIVYLKGSDVWTTSSEGGAPRLLARPDSSEGVRRFSGINVLPGSTRALVVLHSSARGTGRSDLDSTTIGILSLDDGAIKSLNIPGGSPRYSSTGHLLWIGRDNGAYAAPFSLRGDKVGEPVRLAENVSTGGLLAPDLAISQNGWMVIRNAGVSRPRELLMVDRKGAARALPIAPRTFADLALSPDGARVALRIVSGSQYYEGDLWTAELATGAMSRLTSNGLSYRPRWSRDGALLYYMSGIPRESQVVSRPWDGSGGETVLLKRPSTAQIIPGLPHGLAAIRTLDGPRDIYLAPMDSITALRPFIVGPANETDPAISPDGRWLAYQSDESGAVEVYLRPIPGPGPRIPVSVGGGVQAQWSRDGQTLFYRGRTHLMAATLSRGASLAVTKRDSLFRDTFGREGDGYKFELFPDGQHFLFLSAPEDDQRPWTMVVNWPRMLRQAGAAPAQP